MPLRAVQIEISVSWTALRLVDRFTERDTTQCVSLREGKSYVYLIMLVGKKLLVNHIITIVVISLDLHYVELK